MKRPGYSPFNPIFDIPRCVFRDNNNAKMRITSVSGHLMELEFEPQYKSWSSCLPGKVLLFKRDLSKASPLQAH